MKLLDYIRGLRKGKEAHRLEKEAMQDPFLADAMEGYSQVEGNHEQRIEQLQMQVLAHSAKKKNTYAITWSIAACLVIGFGISSYFLFLKKNMADEVFIAKESVPAKMSEPATPITPQKEITSATIKKETDSVPVSEITSKRADKKEMIAKTETTPKPHSAPVTAIPMMDEVAELMVVLEEEAVIMDTSNSEPDKKIKMTKMAAVPNNNMIKGKVTDEKGEPLIGASVIYKGTTVGTVTDINGEFTIAKKEGNKQLTAQYIGYDPVEIPVDTAQTMLIALNENEQALSEVVIVADITPQPVIGKRKYQKYLKENLVRPGDDKCKDVKGEVILSFFVDKEGKPQNITVIHGLCESADKEAIRLVKEGPKWTIGKLPARIAVQF